MVCRLLVLVLAVQAVVRMINVIVVVVVVEKGGQEAGKAREDD